MRLMNLPVKRLSAASTLPTCGSALAIGLDLYASENAVLAPGERRAVATGIAIAVPVGYYGRIAPRSGLAVNNGLDVLAGVIDADFRGEVKVVLINHGTERVFIFAPRMADKPVPATRIGQLVLERADFFNVVEVTGDLPDTVRGTRGWGSTGA